MPDLDERLSLAVAKRDKLASERQRLQGKLEAARSNLAAVEEECRSKGVEPENLVTTITALENRYNEMVENLEQSVAAAEAALAPFMLVKEP